MLTANDIEQSCPIDRPRPLVKTIFEIKVITLSRFVNDYEKIRHHSSQSFGRLINSVQTLAKTISTLYRRSGLGQRHILGKDQDALSPKELTNAINDLAAKCLINSNSACIIAIKNVPDVIMVKEKASAGYMIAISTLEKDINPNAINCGGTSFSIFKRSKEMKKSPPSERDLLQPGMNAVAAGYFVYGHTTIFALGLHDTKVHLFALNPEREEFVLTNDNLTTPNVGYVYSVNEGYLNNLSVNMKSYLAKLANPKNKKPWVTRCSGNAIADCHHVLVSGGIYIYQSKNTLVNDGRMSLLHETVPLAYIAHKVGAAAYSEDNYVLNIVPTGVHDKTALYLGSKQHMQILAETFLGIMVGADVANGRSELVEELDEDEEEEAEEEEDVDNDTAYTDDDYSDSEEDYDYTCK